ncbi:hypothetical protein V8E54_001901 [Elaphomyces granulatus]
MAHGTRESCSFSEEDQGGLEQLVRHDATKTCYPNQVTRAKHNDYICDCCNIHFRVTTGTAYDFACTAQASVGFTLNSDPLVATGEVQTNAGDFWQQKNPRLIDYNSSFFYSAANFDANGHSVLHVEIGRGHRRAQSDPEFSCMPLPAGGFACQDIGRQSATILQNSYYVVAREWSIAAIDYYGLLAEYVQRL